jgi:transcriptional antiterminator
MTVAEVAEHLQVSKRTVESDWTMAKAWLRRWFAKEDAIDTTSDDIDTREI